METWCFSANVSCNLIIYNQMWEKNYIACFLSLWVCLFIYYLFIFMCVEFVKVTRNTQVIAMKFLGSLNAKTMVNPG